MNLSLSLSLSSLLIEMTVGVFAVTLIDFFFFYKYLCATNVCYVQKEDYLNVVFWKPLRRRFVFLQYSLFPWDEMIFRTFSLQLVYKCPSIRT